MKESRTQREKDVTYIWKDSTWRILIPNCRESAIAYGYHTRWCVALKSTDKFFRKYYPMGPMIYIIKNVDVENHKQQLKWFFQIQSNSFANADDNSITAETVYRILNSLPQEAQDKLKALGYNKLSFKLVDTVDPLERQVLIAQGANPEQKATEYFIWGVPQPSR